MKFENGTLVKGAYVVIDGIEHEVHMPKYSGNTPCSAENLNKMQEDIFPIGSTYITQTDTNPNTILGFGTWERVKGKVLVGLDEDDSNFNSIGKTGGEKTHTLTTNEIPTHDHNMNAPSSTLAARGNEIGNEFVVDRGTGMATGRRTTTTGGGQAHNNLQPYQVVGYMWIRTA